MEDGLLSSTVYSIIQDDEGYVWFGTDAGVNRFDGRTFNKYTTDNGLADNEVLRLFQDSKRRIWFLSLNGHLSYYFQGRIYNEYNSPWLKSGFTGTDLIKIHEDRKGNIWFIHNLNESAVMAPDSSFTIIRASNNLRSNASIFVYEDLQNEMYLLSANGAIKLQGDTWISWPFRYYPKNIHSTLVRAGLAYYAANSGIVMMQDTTATLMRVYNNRINQNTITSIRSTREGEVFVNTQHGCFQLLQQGDTAILKPVLTDLIVLDVTEDMEGNMWFATSGTGVYMFPHKAERWKHYTANEGLKNEQVFSLEKIPGGSLWIGANRGVLSEIADNRVQFSAEVFDTGYAYNRILDMCRDKYGNIWCASDRGVLRIIPRHPPVYREFEEYVFPLNITNKTFSVKKITENPQGGITISRYTGILNLEKKGQTGIFYPVPSTLTRRTFTHYFDSNRRLWFANSDGLNYLDTGNTVVQIYSLNRLLHSRITHITSGPQKHLFLSTDGDGVYELSDTLVVNHINMDDGLPSNLCRKTRIYGDTILFCTNAGLLQMSLNKDTLERINLFNTVTGLLSNDVYDAIEESDTLWIATGKGLSMTLTNVPGDNFSTTPPPVHILEFNTTRESFSLDQPVKVPPFDRNIKIQYIGIGFQNPNLIEYQFALATSDTVWNHTQNNSVEFRDLPPGEYTFLLKAKRINGRWSGITSFIFSVEPFFYETTWFRLLMILMVSGVVIFFIRQVSTRRLRRQLSRLRQQEAIQAERSRIATDMHDDIGSDITKITMLANIIVKGRAITPEQGSLNRIIQLSRSLLEKMDNIIWALNPAHDRLPDFISYLRNYCYETSDAANLPIDFNAPLHFPASTLTSIVRRNLFLIIKESITNAMKHSGCTGISVRLELQQDLLKIEISDNGKGMAHDMLPGDGNGLKNMKKRAAEIGAVLKIESVATHGTKIIIVYKIIQDIVRI